MQYTLKKSLGQHFLHNEAICVAIVEALQQSRFSQLAEIGPGGGALTKYLLKLPQIHLKVVEVDDEKVAFLSKTYPELVGHIVHESVLDIEPPFEGAFAVIGNFPYNISTEIVFKMLDWKEQVTVVVGMFQKEVAMRLAAGHGSKVYGVTSVLAQAWYHIEYLFDVGPENFTPPPKVMSGVLRMTPRAEPPAMRSHRHFSMLVKTAFNQRRKQLRNAVRSLFDEQVLQDDMFSKRAEQLSVADFAALTFRMK